MRITTKIAGPILVFLAAILPPCVAFGVGSHSGSVAEFAPVPKDCLAAREIALFHTVENGFGDPYTTFGATWGIECTRVRNLSSDCKYVLVYRLTYRDPVVDPPGTEHELESFCVDTSVSCGVSSAGNVDTHNYTSQGPGIYTLTVLSAPGTCDGYDADRGFTQTRIWEITP